MSKRQKMPSGAKRVFKGEIFEVWQWDQNMYDGSTETFERLRRDNTTQVIATVGDTIMLQMQEQPDSFGPFQSLPGGRLNEGEYPIEGAKRELLEETGYMSDDWTLFREDDPVGKIEWTVYTYIARNCTYRKAPELDPGEKIETKTVSFDEFLTLTDDPEFYGRELKEILLRARFVPKERESLHAAIFGV